MGGADEFKETAAGNVAFGAAGAPEAAKNKVGVEVAELTHQEEHQARVL